MKNIVETAVAAGNFKTLVIAVTTAGLVETLCGPGPFTVFAPTDEAFAKLPKATLDKVLADKEQLTKILTYHVVPGKMLAEEVAEQSAVETVEGGELTISDDDGDVHINDAKVLTADIECSNGVIHAIDTILMPR